ncbi:sensor histidine kinase [Pseudoxanthomonas sp. UC29_72]
MRPTSGCRTPSRCGTRSSTPWSWPNPPCARGASGWSACAARTPASSWARAWRRSASASADGPAPSLRLLIEGQPRALPTCVAEEAFLIGREALTNALRHAQAKAIEVEIGYGREALHLRVRDDGVGMPADAQARRAHFGLRGMRERAARIGGTLQVWSAPRMGTEIALSVPAARAYAVARTRWWQRLRRASQEDA